MNCSFQTCDNILIFWYHIFHNSQLKTYENAKDKLTLYPRIEKSILQSYVLFVLHLIDEIH